MRPNFNDMANLSLTSPSNGSATFNGTSDYVQTSNLPFQSSATWTYSAWVNLTDVAAARYFFDGREDSLDGFGVYSANTGRLTYYDGNAGRETNAIFPMATWFYLTITRSGTDSVNFYINGSLAQTLTGAQTSYSVTGNFYIGSRFTGDETFKGNLANVAVWNRALTSDEINSIQWKRYDLLTSGESTGLVAWYALDDITGTSVPDSTGTYNATAY
jgi:hypothetical protein